MPTPQAHIAREIVRLERLHEFAILDSAPEQDFNTVVELLRTAFNAPIALVSMIDESRQWFKAKCGIEVDQTPRDMAFCAHAIHAAEILIVEDAAKDPRFVDNPLVTGPPYIRFYAGVPLRPWINPKPGEEISGIGTACIIDTKPRTLDDRAKGLLIASAAMVSSLVACRTAASDAIALSREAHEQAKVLERQHLQLRQAERMAQIGSWRLDLSDNSIHWSDQVYVIHGLPSGKMPSVDEALSFYPPERREEVAKLLERGATLGESFDFESDFITADGKMRRVRSVGEPLMLDGRPVALIGVFQDITDRHERELILRQTADTDALTGLPNRACFEQELTKVLTRTQNHVAPALIMLLDLDGFKAVNDTFGHAAGDEVLRLMADRLRRKAGNGMFAARLGGDEFVILLTRPRDCARAEAYISETLHGLHHTVERDGKKRSVSATIGAAFIGPDDAQPHEALRRADIALYEAKRQSEGTGKLFGEAALLT